jgi:hypothetical protein
MPMAGINSTLYGKAESLLTREEMMDKLHIKDRHTFTKVVKEMEIPYIKIGKEYMFPVSKFNQWVAKNTVG